MGKLVLKMSMSLDGFVGGPNGEVDWAFPGFDQTATDFLVETLWNADLHVMGRRTFDDMKAWWPGSSEPFAPPMNEIPKAFFTRTEGVAAPTTTRAFDDASRRNPDVAASAAEGRIDSWNAARRLTGDLVDGISTLKASVAGNVLAHGGAGFVRELLPTGLVDAYVLLIHPVALGRGLDIFSGLATPLDLELAESRRFPSGVVANTYRAAGS